MINIPDKVQYTDTGMIYLTGGSNNDGYAVLISIMRSDKPLS